MKNVGVLPTDTEGRIMSFFFFFNDTATTEIYTLSLHDALPICSWHQQSHGKLSDPGSKIHALVDGGDYPSGLAVFRSEEHTSELQSH